MDSNYKAIEVIAKELDTPVAVLSGVMTANGWKSGKQISVDEFKTACNFFLNARADGKEIVCGQK